MGLHPVALRQALLEKFGIEEDKMRSKLWGDNYFNKKTNKWSKKSGEDNIPRAFCQFIMDPFARCSTR